MRRRSAWFLDNWQIFTLTFIAIGISGYSLIVSIFNPNLTLIADRKIDLILLLLGAYVLSASKKFHESHLLGEKLLLTQNSMRNQRFIPYSLLPLTRRLLELEQELLDKKMTFRNYYEVMSALIKIMDSSQKTYQGLNFYGRGWQRGMSEFYDANIGAVERGIEVTRYFVIKDEYINDGSLQDFINEMKRQEKKGVNVFFISDSDIKKIGYFRDNPIRGIGLFDDEVLVVDRSQVSQHEAPVELTVYWEPINVAQFNPFPHLHDRAKPFSEFRQELDELIAE